MMAIWKVPTIHEYSCGEIWRSRSRVGAATASVLRVR
jgi:hypothetical protein